MEVSIFYKNVTVIDYAFFDELRGFVGNSFIVNVRFYGEKNQEGVLFDFSKAKKKVKEIIDCECDHRLIVPRGIIKRDRNQLHLGCDVNGDQLEYSCPLEAVWELNEDYIATDKLQYWLEQLVNKEMPENIRGVQIELLSESDPDNHKYFNYTHGLKNHDGNCQRLLHGHRSTFKIFLVNQRMFEWEDLLFEEILYRPLHFAFWENVVNKKEIAALLEKKSKEIEGIFSADKLKCPIHLKYSSRQGTFEIKLKADMVYFLQKETTVENLTIHFAHLVKMMFKENRQISVHMFEGVGKGATATL